MFGVFNSFVELILPSCIKLSSSIWNFHVMNQRGSCRSDQHAGETPISLFGFYRSAFEKRSLKINELIMSSLPANTRRSPENMV